MRTHRHGAERGETHGTDGTRARTAPPAAPLLALQRSAGNAAVSRLVGHARSEEVVQRSPESSRPPSRASQKSEESQHSENSQASAHSMTPADRRQIKFTQDKAELLRRVGRIQALTEMDGFMSGIEGFHVRTQKEFEDLPQAPTDQAWRDKQSVIDQQQRGALADIHSREEEIAALDVFVSDLFRSHGRDLRFRDTSTPPNTRAGSARESPRSGSPGA
ncbi:hypothetical protein [Streptomyces sp. NPDC001091]